MSASHLLSCLADGTTFDEIKESFGPFEHEVLKEALMVGSEVTGDPDVAA